MIDLCICGEPGLHPIWRQAEQALGVICPPCLTTLQMQLQTIRSAIGLYNEENPANQYDHTSIPDSTFWDPLLVNNYLRTEPANPLQNFSTAVGAAPAISLGWVWGEAPGGDAWTLNLYAVDENGGWYDSDGDGIPD